MPKLNVLPLRKSPPLPFSCSFNVEIPARSDKTGRARALLQRLDDFCPSRTENDHRGLCLWSWLINGGLTLHRETFLNMAVVAVSQVETAHNEINANGVNANC